MESHTISWLPASLNIVLLRRDPEQGKNFDLPSTLKIAKSQGADVSAWGPFQIRKELYDRALAQIKRLETGKVGFKALDRAFRPDAATNCFHAISDIVDGPLLNTGTAFGAPASEMVVQHLSPFFVEPRQPQPWVADALGLQKYGLAFRK
jgi:hypothetical protein